MNDMEKLFHAQSERIIERNFHAVSGLSEKDFITNYISPLKEILIKTKVKARLEENRIPFIIVVPSTIVPLSYQLDSIREAIHDKKYDYIIKPEWFENAKGVTTPKEPYLLLDVETGYAMQNISPKRCVEKFKAEGRSPLTLDEGLALVTHSPEVLESHWLDLPGSVLIHRCAAQDARQRGVTSALPPGFGLVTFIPTLYYKYYNSLRLYYIAEMTETPYSGSASCKARVSRHNSPYSGQTTG